MNNKYKLVAQLLADSMNSAAAINSYESLPTRNSPKLVVSQPEEIEDRNYKKDEYPFMTLNRVAKKLSSEKESSK